MKKEIRLVKTCVGLVSKNTLMSLSDRAVEIALDTEISYEEAFTILLKLVTYGNAGWYKDGDEFYFDLKLDYDYFVLNEEFTGTEIAFLYNQNENLIYNIATKKFYYEYPIDEYGDDMMKVEVRI